jgi:chitinase
MIYKSSEFNILSSLPFAGSGNFIPQWDTNTYNPSAILADKQANNRVWFASLFGDQPTWVDPPNQITWINNAVNSLQSMIQQYYLDGLDIDLENGLTSTWVNCMTTVLQQLKATNPSLLITLTPFEQTWQFYASMYNANPSLYDGINYQYYAEGSATDVNAAVNRYETLASTSNIPLSKFYFMADTNQGSPLGIQPPYSFQAYQQLRQQNPPIKGVTVWSADNDWHYAQNYNTENTFAQY